MTGAGACIGSGSSQESRAVRVTDNGRDQGHLDLVVPCWLGLWRGMMICPATLVRHSSTVVWLEL